MLRLLNKADAPQLQSVFDACVDYAMLQDGQPFPPDAAEVEFEARPPGVSSEAKYVFGLEDSSSNLVGLIEGIAGYPNDDVWYIGLLLVVPQARARGVGKIAFGKLLQRIKAEARYGSIQLAVLQENRAAAAFWYGLGFTHLRDSPATQFGTKSHERHVLQLTLNDD